jgi:hypothetical protein
LSDFQSVFLNTPYDPAYQPLFVTLVSTLVCLGLKPHCVLEIQEKGQGRLARTFHLLGSCGVSVHDLSRTGPPARLNMPFELGLACGLKLSGTSHEIVVLDSIDYRLDKTLSDYKGRDPWVHHNRCDQLITCLLDAFEVANEPAPSELRSAARVLRQSARQLAKQYRTQTIFRAATFRALVSAATQLAQERGFIPP